MEWLPGAKTALYGIIGHPVGHSLSPSMHNAGFRALGIDAVYLAFDVGPGRLSDALLGVRALGIRGLSVTIPHKEAVIPLLDEVDETAGTMGAVNTIFFRDGRLLGMNTDWLGVVKALEVETALAGRKVLVLGAGGSARAVAFGLTKRGATVHIANRTPEKARVLAGLFGGTWSGLDGIGDVGASILVNTTSVGMAPEASVSPVPAEILPGVDVVMDLVYRPRETRLLREAREAGCRVVDGLSMLLHQGVAQFELWTGREPPLKTMSGALEEALKVKEIS